MIIFFLIFLSAIHLLHNIITQLYINIRIIFFGPFKSSKKKEKGLKFEFANKLLYLT